MRVISNMLELLKEDVEESERQIKELKKSMLFLSHNDYVNRVNMQRALTSMEKEKRATLNQIYKIERDQEFYDRKLEAEVSRLEAQAQFLNENAGLDKVDEILDKISNLDPTTLEDIEKQEKKGKSKDD